MVGLLVEDEVDLLVFVSTLFVCLLAVVPEAALVYGKDSD